MKLFEGGSRPTVVDGVLLAAAGVILGMVIWPIQTGERESAKATQCLSNLKQIMAGFSLYGADYDDRLPFSSAWMDTLQPYDKNEQILHCPILALPFDGPNDGVKYSGYGYAMNRYLSGKELPALTAASEMPLAFETKNPARNVREYIPDFPIPGRHKGKSNLVFADGHARSRKTE